MKGQWGATVWSVAQLFGQEKMRTPGGARIPEEKTIEL